MIAPTITGMMNGARLPHIPIAASDTIYTAGVVMVQAGLELGISLSWQFWA